MEPRDPVMPQSSGIDVHFDRFFRVFGSHRYPHIGPAEEQLELTRLIEIGNEETFVLCPGEFVLGSTREQVNLPAMMAARLEGKSSLD